MFVSHLYVFFGYILTFHIVRVPQNTLWEMEYYSTNVKEFQLSFEGKENCSELKADALKNTTNGKNRCTLSVQQFTIHNQKEDSE